MKRKEDKEQSRNARQKQVDLVGLDFSATGTKVVRLKNGRNGFSLVGISQLPVVDFSESAQKFELPRDLASYYGCLAYSGKNAVMRVVNVSLPADGKDLSDEKLHELLNVNEEYRVAAYVTKRGKGRQESSLLAAAIPEKDAQYLLSMFATGAPAPVSIEVSGLSYIPAFMNARGFECSDQAVCLIEAGEELSSFVFLNQGKVSLVGKFGFGVKHLRKKVVDELGVDDELAASILTDRSINISTTLDAVMSPFLKQLSISKDFIERHHSCRVLKVYLSGGMSLIPHWPSMVQQMLKVEAIIWSPFENIQYDPELIPEELRGQDARFAAAVGAVIGGF